MNYSRQNTDSNTIIPNPQTPVSDSGNSNSFGIGYLFHTKIGGLRTNSDNLCRSNLALGAAFSAGFGESINSKIGKSNPESYSLRLGAGYRISQGRYLYTDLQYGEYAGRDPTTGINESIDVYRLFSGVQWQIPRKPGDSGLRVFLRGGFVVDMKGKKSYTLGLGTVLYNSHFLKIGADFGYQHNMFPEIAHEFGGSDLYNLSVRFTLK